MKLVVNSAYGYRAASGELTRFADVHAANEVTRYGRETLELMCRELAARGVTLLEADTDGVYFAVPEGWGEADEQRVVAEVAALLPPLVQLEFEGELPYEAMLASGRTSWGVGDRIRVYRTKSGSGGVIQESEDETVATETTNGRDYDVDHYARLLRETFAARLTRAFTLADCE